MLSPPRRRGHHWRRCSHACLSVESHHERQRGQPSLFFDRHLRRCSSHAGAAVLSAGLSRTCSRSSSASCGHSWLSGQKLRYFIMLSSTVVGPIILPTSLPQIHCPPTSCLLPMPRYLSGRAADEVYGNSSVTLISARRGMRWIVCIPTLSSFSATCFP